MTRNTKTLLFAFALTSTLAIAGAAFGQDDGSAAPTGPQAFYEENCVRCHGEDGQAATRMAERYGVEPFTTAKFTELGRDGIRDAMVNGSENMDPVEGVEGAELEALIDYVQTLAQ